MAGSIPSGNPMFMATGSANPYPSMPSNLGEWGNNLRRFTVILHSENCGKDFELFVSDFCCDQCAEDYFVHPK